MKTKRWFDQTTQLRAHSTLHPGVPARREKIVLFGVAVAIVLGTASLTELRAQPAKSKAVSSQQSAKVSVDEKSRSTTRSDSSLIKRIVLFPVRAGKSVAGIFFTRESHHGSAPLSNQARIPPAVAEAGEPEVTMAVVPTYPLLALHAHNVGEVVLDLKINSDGEVITVEPVSGAPLLIGGSKSVARLWRFTPSADKASLRRARLIFAYRLVPRNTPANRIQPIFKPPYRMEIVRAMPDDSPLP